MDGRPRHGKAVNVQLVDSIFASPSGHCLPQLHWTNGNEIRFLGRGALHHRDDSEPTVAHMGFLKQELSQYLIKNYEDISRHVEE